MGLEERKRLLLSFGVFVRALPVHYKTLVYRNSDFSGAEELKALIRRDLVSFIFDHLTFFQSFDVVKIYYDDGQPAVTSALHAAVEYALARNVAVYRASNYRCYRLAQVADYLCAIELAAAKYEAHEETETDIKFYGGIGSFKKNWLKQARRKAL